MRLKNKKNKIATYRVTYTDGCERREIIDYNIYAKINFYLKKLKFQVCVHNYNTGDEEEIFESKNVEMCIKEVEKIASEYHHNSGKWLGIKR